MVTSVILRIYAMGPHGGALRVEHQELQSVKLIPPDVFVLIANQTLILDGMVVPATSAFLLPETVGS